MFNNLNKKIKYLVINRLNKSSEWCWNSLFYWYFSNSEWKELKSCKDLYCPRNDTYAYCGKCDSTGKMKEVNNENS